MFKVDDILRTTRAEYKLTAELGDGGRGQAFSAVVLSVADDGSDKNSELTRGMQVAVKLPPDLRAEYTHSQQRQFLTTVNESLRREYRVLDRLSGVKGAAHVLDCGSVPVSIGQDRDVCFFLVSQYVNGVRLDHWRQQNRDKLSHAEFFLLWAGRLAAMLNEVHRAGVVHGDVHSKNIIVRHGSEPVLIDFGSSVIRSAALPSIDIEPSHPYLAPEKERSVEADIYSLCGTLHFLATGCLPPAPDPITGRSRDAVVKAMQETNPLLYQECSGIANVIARGVRHRDRGRTPDAERLLGDIDLFDPRAAAMAKDTRALIVSIESSANTLYTMDPMFARILGARLHQLEQDALGMLHDIHDVRGDHDHLVDTLCRYLSVCDPDDVYLAASLPWLWHEANMGARGRFLAMNKQVIKRGARVRRVFLLTESDLQDPETIDVLRAHCDMLTEIDEETAYGIDTRVSNIDKPGAYTGVLLTSLRVLETKFANLPHCGIWVRGSNSKMVIPRYDEDSRIVSGLRLVPGDGRPEALFSSFTRDYLRDSMEVRSFLDDIDGTNGAEARVRTA